MATFLTTDRMSPELRARVERAVSSRAKARHNAQKTAMKEVFAGPSKGRAAWLVPVAALFVVAGLFGSMQLHEHRTIEDQRGEVLASLAVHRLAWSKSDDERLATIEKQMMDLSKEVYPGDMVAPEMAAAGELDAWLARPAVYVRGATTDLRDPHKQDDAASRSLKDAFLLCLVDPPPSHGEPDLLGKVRGVNFGGAKVDDETANVRRLYDARVAQATLGPRFETAVQQAATVSVLRKLSDEIEASPIQSARAVVSAELLILVADEVGADAVTPVSSNGGKSQRQPTLEDPHDVRVALVDLAEDKVLLRTRHRVDASGRSRNARSMYGAAMQSCELALDMRDAARD